MDDNSCSKHINIQCDEYIKYHIQKSEELANIKLAALQSEFTKSERVYPTKEQIDEKIKDLASAKDLDGLNLQLKAIWVLLVILFGVIIELLSKR